jgi:diguanylate cyclase (GGDEF)-like protein/PAS domain S-box-containing protein
VEPSDGPSRDEAARWYALVANTRDIVAIIGPDGRFNYVSPAIERILGWAAAELVGMVADDGLHYEDRGVTTQRLVEYAETEGVAEPVEYRVPTTDGSWRFLEAVATDLRADPAVGGIVINARDITDRKRAEALLANQSAVLEFVARGEPLAATLDRITAMLEEHAPDADASIFLHDAGAGATTGWRQPIIDAETDAVLGSVSLRPGDRRFPTADEQRVAGLAANLASIAISRARAVEQLRHQARHDPLTGLANREVFLDRLEAALAAAEERGDTIAVLFVDLDRFKDVNDTLGHDIGDRVLVALARRLESAVRLGDTVARLGGDEFVLVCRVEGRQHAQLVADRVLDHVRSPYTVGEQEVELTASIGIALGDDARDVVGLVTGHRPAELLRDADVAMYRAKERGRARAEVFDDSLRTRLLDRTETEQALRRALQRHEFELAYQPIYSLDDGALASCEALLRWRRPGHGLVLPGEFIEAAEVLGLIVPIGEWVLREACRQFASWQHPGSDATPFTLSVNVSPNQLLDPGFVGTVRSILAETDVPAEMLSLEMTERALLGDFVGAVLALDELRDLGVSVWLDDFGTGYSSLEHLKRLSLDGLKLDRSFVSGLAADATDEAIVGAVITMAHALGMAVVGEGVERVDQRERLTHLACDYAQGFLFARPLAAGAFAEQVLTPAPVIATA